MLGGQTDPSDLDQDGFHAGLNHLGEQLFLVPLPKITEGCEAKTSTAELRQCTFAPL